MVGPREGEERHDVCHYGGTLHGFNERGGEDVVALERSYICVLVLVSIGGMDKHLFKYKKGRTVKVRGWVFSMTCPNAESARKVSMSMYPCFQSSVQMIVVSEKTLPRRDPHEPNVPTKHGPVHAAGTAPKGRRPRTKTHIAHPVVDPTHEPTKGLAALRI